MRLKEAGPMPMSVEETTQPKAFAISHLTIYKSDSPNRRSQNRQQSLNQSIANLAIPSPDMGECYIG
jgi:hypothetical protein